jgi:hypothetical protein
MTSTELLGLHPDTQTRVRAEHFVMRQIVLAAIAKGGQVWIRDEEATRPRLHSDWYGIKADMHATDEQYVGIVFPPGALGEGIGGAGITMYLVYGNSGPDVVADYSTAGSGGEEADAWFEPIWDKAVEDAGRKYGIEV